jgi:uncharacterized membrane protein
MRLSYFIIVARAFMAYCVQCGKQVGEADQYCSGCGRVQKEAVPNDPANFWANVSDDHAATLCYIPWVGWIAGVAVLASAKFRGNKRLHFHAFQGLYIFVAWLLVQNFASPLFHFGRGFPGQSIPGLLSLVVFGTWIFMLIKVHNHEDYRLPLLGELADRSVSEQKL